MKKKIVCELSGGLGNQMFCYASAYAVAKYYDGELYIDTSSFYNDRFGRKYELENFNISARNIGFKRNIAFNKLVRWIKLKMYRIVTEYDKFGKEKSIGLLKENRLYLDLFWHQQNYHLFHSFKGQIIEEFKYTGHISPEYQNILEQNKEYYTIAVHLRYGDYVELGCCLDYAYYESAVNRILEELQPTMKEINKEIRLVIFSEDIDTAKKIISNIKGDFSCLYINSYNKLTDLEEFWLMSQCNSHIISNSTFSWWAAYLNSNVNGIVIAPIVIGWMDNGCWEKDYFPKDWIKIETKLLS